MSEKQVNVVDCNRKSDAVNVEGNKKRKKCKSDKQGNAEDCNRNVEGVNVVDSEKRKEATSKEHVIVDDCNEDKKDIVGRNQVKDASYLAEVAKISGKMNFYDHITLGNCSPLEAKQKILGEVIKLGHKIFVSMEFEEESELERQLQMVRGECDDAKLKISSLTKEVSTLKKKLEKQTKELEDRDANLVLAQVSLASAEEEVQRLKKEIEDVAARKDQERAEALEKEREEARSNQSMRNSLSGAIDIFERNLAEEKNQTGPLNEELSRLYKLACDTLFQYFMDKGVIDKKVLLALQGEEKKKYDQLKVAAKDRASSQAPSGADSGEADVSEEEDDSGTQTTNTTTSVTTFTFDITPSTQLPVTPSVTPQTGYSLDIDN